MSRICWAEQSQVLVRAPRQPLPETLSALPFVALNLPLSLAESNCLYQLPFAHLCPGVGFTRLSPLWAPQLLRALRMP